MFIIWNFYNTSERHKLQLIVKILKNLVAISYHIIIIIYFLGRQSKCMQPGACSGNGDCLEYGYFAGDYKGYTCQCFDGYMGDKCEYEGK